MEGFSTATLNYHLYVKKKYTLSFTPFLQDPVLGMIVLF